MKELPFSKTRSVIAEELQVDRKTLRRMLRVNGIDLPSGPVYLPWQKLIYETFGYPERVDESAFSAVEAALKKED